jgi:hypothetical protein
MYIYLSIAISLRVQNYLLTLLKWLIPFSVSWFPSVTLSPLPLFLAVAYQRFCNNIIVASLSYFNTWTRVNVYERKNVRESTSVYGFESGLSLFTNENLGSVRYESTIYNGFLYQYPSQNITTTPVDFT